MTIPALLPAGAALACLLALGACGEDSTPSAAPDPTAAPAQSAAAAADLCAAKVAVDATELGAPDLQEPSETPSPEEIAAEKAKLEARYGPAYTRLEQAAGNSAVAAEVATLVRLAREGISETDGAFAEEPEFATAEGRVDEFLAQNCGFGEVAITALDHEYDGVPTAMPAGVAGITLKNAGQEFHELVLLRYNDGVTLSAEELVALGDPEEILEQASIRGLLFGMPNTSSTGFFDLPEGRYVAVCFVPEGSTEEADFEGDGPPHATLGMLAELTVGDVAVPSASSSVS